MRLLLVCLNFLLLPAICFADPQCTLRSAKAPVVKLDSDHAGALKSSIRMHVEGIGEYLKANCIFNPDFVLYLNGTPFRNLAVATPTEGNDNITFYLDRVDTNRDQWVALLRQPVPVRTLPVTVGLSTGVTFGTELTKFQLRLYRVQTFRIAFGLFVVLLGLFIWVARTSDVLRESGPEPSPVSGKVRRRAYSLARVQMAVWFFIVIASFSFIWMITFGLDTISPSILALIGISTGAGLAAAVIDHSKAASMRSQRDQLASEDSGLVAALAALSAKPLPLSPADIQAQTAATARRLDIASELADIDRQISTPAHVNFLIDILSDADGISFHRFQMACWTTTLTIIFLVSVWKDLVMPEFSTTLLGLMGISAGTYLGFKFPEVKN